MESLQPIGGLIVSTGQMTSSLVSNSTCVPSQYCQLLLALVHICQPFSASTVLSTVSVLLISHCQQCHAGYTNVQYIHIIYTYCTYIAHIYIYNVRGLPILEYEMAECMNSIIGNLIS